jgi:outer membrane protein OmpA-like peptidoglycan-associated protein
MKILSHLLFLGFLLVLFTKLASAQSPSNEVYMDDFASLSHHKNKIHHTDPAPHDTVRYVLIVDANAHLNTEEEKVPIIVLDTVDQTSQRKLNLQSTLNTLLFQHNILFKYNDYVLSDDSKYALDLASMIMRANPDAVFEIGGHADSRGLFNDNMVLTEKRVESAIEYLVSKGVSRKQLVAVAYSESVLKNVCDSDSYCGEEVHASNRRIEIKLLRVGK